MDRVSPWPFFLCVLSQPDRTLQDPSAAPAGSGSLAGVAMAWGTQPALALSCSRHRGMSPPPGPSLCPWRDLAAPGHLCSPRCLCWSAAALCPPHLSSHTMRHVGTNPGAGATALGAVSVQGLRATRV